ncbi:hypothetical protein FDB40_17610 [Clostridium botulinum]|nr:hypothetical protein [Clostridium botulinum]
MDKEEMIRYYKKAEREWEHLTPKEKAEKIKGHINALLENEEKDEGTKQELQKQLVMLEEVDNNEIEDYLDAVNKVIMENCMKNIDENYK